MDHAKRPYPLHNIFPHAAFRGTVVPPVRTVDLGSEFHPRSSDIFIGTYAKSGTTWLQNMIYELLDCPNGPLENMFRQIPWLQAEPPVGISQEKIEAVNYLQLLKTDNSPMKPVLEILQQQIETMNSPRIFKLHAYWGWLPDNVKETCRFIYCYRNPKDVAVSYWHHINSLRFAYGDKAADLPFPKFFDEIFSDENVCEYGLWENHVMDWLKNAAKKDNVLFLTYEDLSENTERELRKIASFLGLDVTDEHVAKVLNASSFSTMKKNPAVNMKQMTGENGDFIRNGKVGNWRDYLTEEQSGMLDGKIEMVRKAGGDIRCTL